MTLRALSTVSFLALAALPLAAQAQNFASTATGYSAPGVGAPFNNPQAALGQPTTLFNDPYSDPANSTFHRSLVAASDGTAPDGSNTVVSLGTGGTLTVQFQTPIVHDAAHWFGDDLIVFSNQAFNGDDNGTFVTPTTDMDAYHVSGTGSTYSKLPTVSVSPDGTNWFTYPASSGTMTDPSGQPVNDGFGGTSYFYPENAYAWNSAAHDWGNLQDFTKPVNPSLTYHDFAGKTVAQAIGLYNGSAGGTAFSLAGTGFTSIQYVRFTGTGNIDGVSRVALAAAPEPAPWVVLGLGAAGLLFLRRRRASA